MGLEQEEYEDDKFCLKMLKEYLEDTDPDKDKGIELEKLAKELGIELK